MMFIRTILLLSLATFSLAVPVAQSDSELPSIKDSVDSFNEGGTEVGSGAAELVSSTGAGAVRLVFCGLGVDLGNSDLCGEEGDTRIPGHERYHANFSKTHRVLSNHVLPSFKRFAIGTELVQDAAKSWTFFSEHVAQVHIPGYTHFRSPVPHARPVQPHFFERARRTLHSLKCIRDSTVFNSNHTPSENSFLPTHAAVSSAHRSHRARTSRSKQQHLWLPPSTPPTHPGARSLSPHSSASTVNCTNSPTQTQSPPQPLPPHSRHPRAPPTRLSHSARRTTRNDDGYEVEDYEGEPTIPVNMSPPVTVPFARLPTSRLLTCQKHCYTHPPRAPAFHTALCGQQYEW
ncbi:hypothetical protein V8E53_012126 [Lactarius tabidus]